MSKKIAIIGGGICGLSLGYFLSNKNIEVTVFEKNKQLGGLLSQVEIYKNISIEKFYHHVFPFDKDVIDLYKNLNLLDDLKWHESSTSIFLDGDYKSFSNLKDYLLLPKLSLLERLHLLAGGYIFSKKQLFAIKNMKASNAIKKYMGLKSWEILWEPLFNKKLGKYKNNVLASWFWWRMNSKLQSKDKKETLGYPNGGFKRLIDKLAQSICKNGGKIINSTKIDSIKKVAGKFLINNEYFNKIIFTTPSIETNKILNMKSKNVIKYRSVINVLLVLKKPQTKCYWNNILDKEIPFVGIIEHTNLTSSRNYQDKALIHLTQYLDSKSKYCRMSDEEIFFEYRKHFSKVGIAKKDVLSYSVNREKYSQPILENVPKHIGYQKIEKNIYSINMENVYPEDRGINQSIKYAKKLASILG